MKTKAYWIIRHYYQKIIFQIKGSLFHISESNDQSKQIRSIHLGVLKTIVLQLIKALIIAYIVTRIDGILLKKPECQSFKADIFKDIVLGGLGIAGVILGLYCANVASIFSAKYTNVPESLSNAFRNDIVTNDCIKRIIGYIVICIVFLLECVIDIDLYWSALLVLLFLTVRMVITFSVTGNRTYALSDTFTIAGAHYIRIIAVMKKITNRKLFARDANFQNHVQKICERHMQALLDIAKYNIDIPKNQNPAMLTFMLKNVKLIEYYWGIKPTIYHESRWFKDKIEYKQWHYASDTAIQIASKNGRALEADAKRNHWWFEDKLLHINEICLDKLIADADFEMIQRYVMQLRSISEYSSAVGAISYWINYLGKIQQCIWTKVSKISEDNQKNDETTISALIEVVCCSYLDIITSIRTWLMSLDVEREFCVAKGIKKYSKFEYSHCYYLNDPDCERMYQQIEAEYAIENRRITPDWFIEQTVAYRIYRKLGEEVDGLVKVLEGILLFGNRLLDNKDYFSAAVVFSHCFELTSMYEDIVVRIEKMLSKLEGKHFDSNIVWEKVSLDSMRKVYRNVEIDAPKNLIKCSGAFALYHWKNREDSPDFLGFCYNHLCEYLLRAIENDDYEKFAVTYPDFLNLVLLYQEYVRTSVIKRKEKHLQNIVFHVATAPFAEYAIISSLAIIWGEFTQNTSWKMLVDSTLEQFVDASPEKNKSILERITECVSADRHAILGIGNRHILQTEWEMRIARMIMRNPNYETAFQDFGIEILKTDSKLLRAFVGTVGTLHRSHLQLSDSKDVYFILCINRYLEEDQKYRSQSGWEDRLNETTVE